MVPTHMLLNLQEKGNRWAQAHSRNLPKLKSRTTFLGLQETRRKNWHLKRVSNFTISDRLNNNSKCHRVAIMTNITCKTMLHPPNNKIKGRTWDQLTLRVWKIPLKFSKLVRTKDSPTIRWVTSSPWMALKDPLIMLSRTLETSLPTRWRGLMTEWIFISSRSRRTGPKWSTTTIKLCRLLKRVRHSANPKDSGDRGLDHTR